MHHTEQLLFLSRTLHGAADLGAALDSVNAFIASNTRYRACWVVMRAVDETHLELVGNPRPDIQGAQMRMESILLEHDPLLRHLFTAEEPFCMPDLREEAMADQAQVAHFGNRTLIAVPMLPFGGRIGAMAVGTFAEVGVMEPTPAEFDLIVRVASLLSLVVTRIRAEQKAKALAESIQASERLESLGRLAGEVAHDFNNVLTAISGNASLAIEELGEHPARAYIDEIQAASKRAADLSQQLLTFSQGRLLQPKPIALPEVMDSLSRMLSRLMPKHIDLGFQSASELPHVLADRSQLEQLVMNLVLNARDAMPQGGKLLVTTTCTTLGSAQLSQNEHASPGEFLCIAVQDTGVGIPEDAQPHIFEPFFSTKNSQTGTGLGLSVVHSVIQKHRGHLHFSTSDSGTTFYAYLPTTKLQPQAKAKAAEASGRVPKELVVIADDQLQIRTLLGRVLERAGYQVQVCVDGQEAMHFIEENPNVAVVLSDVSMPKMGGHELAAELQKQTASPEVILMTGYDPGRDHTSRSAHILHKPFGMKQLLSLLDQILTKNDAA